MISLSNTARRRRRGPLWVNMRPRRERRFAASAAFGSAGVANTRSQSRDVTRQMTQPSRHHEDRRPDADAIVEISHILIQHADAAIGGGAADGGAHPFSGAVDRHLESVERQCKASLRIARDIRDFVGPPHRREGPKHLTRSLDALHACRILTDCAGRGLRRSGSEAQ